MITHAELYMGAHMESYTVGEDGVTKITSVEETGSVTIFYGDEKRRVFTGWTSKVLDEVKDLGDLPH